ncbi:MAG TPA: outer membrane beta-barrel protein [Prolixibacteraceae bacterium]|nr:outer membrane beta-barrel protein [Prolixibacteraceae bacterium]
MHKLILLLIAALFGIQTLKAQDLIVTTRGDSINCHITLKTYDYLRFRYKHDNEIKASSLPFNEISSYQYNFYQGTVIPKAKKIRNHDYQHWRLAANSGISRHIAQTAPNLSSEEKQQAEDFKTGKIYGADIQYYITEPLGLGIKYVNFSSSADYSTQSYVSQGHLAINCIDLGVNYRLLNESKKNALFFNLGPAYVDYRLDDSYRGKNLGWMGGIGYDIAVSELFSLGLQVSYLSCSLKKIDYYSNGKYISTYKLRQGGYESLHRIDFSAGIRFNL